MAGEHGGLHGALLVLLPVFPFVGSVLNIEVTLHLFTLAQEALTCPLP